MGFGGMTKQNRPVAAELAAGGTRLTRLLVNWHADCSDGDRVTLTTAARGVPVRQGSFRSAGRQSVPQGDGSVWTIENSVSGRVAASSLSGTFRTVLTGVEAGRVLFRCDTGALKLALPRAYAGETAQHTPFVLRTSKDNRLVTGAVVTWRAPCNTGSSYFFAGPVTLEGGAVGTRGLFEASSTRLTDLGGGAEARVEQGVDRGVLAPRVLTATWSAVATVRDASTGEQLHVCRTGPIPVTAVR